MDALGYVFFPKSSELFFNLKARIIKFVYNNVSVYISLSYLLKINKTQNGQIFE